MELSAPSKPHSPLGILQNPDVWFQHQDPYLTGLGYRQDTGSFPSSLGNSRVRQG